MENRDNQLIALRPALNLEPASGIIEQFQNKTIRPVLKFQNQLILEISRNQFIKRKSVFFKLSEPKQLEYIEQQIKQDKNFKNLLAGIVIGHFSMEEWLFFQENEQELRKRITSMLIQRIQSQVELIIP